jgi:hypothetical protein
VLLTTLEIVVLWNSTKAQGTSPCVMSPVVRNDTKPAWLFMPGSFAKLASNGVTTVILSPRNLGRTIYA